MSDYSESYEARVGADRMVAGLSCIPDPVRGDLAEVARLRDLLREARDSVRKHWRGHRKSLERAIRNDRLDTIAIETKREAELRDLRDRIDAALAGEKP